MIQLRKILVASALVGMAFPVGSVAAQSGINLQSSEYREWSSLPRSGEPDRKPWVGYWWSYEKNGMAWAYDGGLSPAEKYDAARGNDDAVDLDAIEEHIRVLQDEVHPLENERRDLVQDLNRAIARDEDYRDCSDYPDDSGCVEDAEQDCSCPWNRYRELGDLIEQAKSEVPAVEVDTVTEFEHMSHGQGVAGVEGWWGHCNAWAAAAILEPEPVREVEAFGQQWKVGDVKALLTEGYMEVNSAFYGTRLYDEEPSALSREVEERIRELVGKGESDYSIKQAIADDFEDVEDVDVTEYLEWFRAYNDVTPADFHILFSVYLGQLGRSFVIDRYTGSQVWNQPVSHFESHVVREMEPTEDGLHPILVEATMEWATDGVDPDATNESRGSSGFHDRTLTYTLYLDKPADDPNARIVGPGLWEQSASPSSHAHPDFIWVPTSDAPAARRRDGTYYENPHLDMRWVTEELLPLSVAGAEDPEDPEEPGEPVTELSGSASPDADIVDMQTTESTITLSGEGTVAGGVQVSVDIEHSYIGDLEVVLAHGGRQAILHNRSGGGQSDLVRELTTDELDGLDVAGEWTLRVTDNARRDEGSLRSWSVSVLTGEGPGGGGDDTGPAAEEHATVESLPQPIEDGTGAERVVTFEVPGSFEVGSAELELDIVHTWIGDLKVVLAHGGTEQVLHDQQGGSADNIARSFELSRFAGEDAGGTWTLRVSDHADYDEGEIAGAVLRLVPAE